MQTFNLPCPPSVNEMFRNLKHGGRADTAIYRDWKGHAGWVLEQQKVKPVAGFVVIVVSVERGSKRADIDNRIKATFDLLVREKIIDDDSKVSAFAASWAPPANKLERVMLIPAEKARGMKFRLQLSDDGSYGGWFLDNEEDNFDGDFPEFDQEDVG